jgi:S1-C subfamily serine protease
MFTKSLNSPEDLLVKPMVFKNLFVALLFSLLNIGCITQVSSCLAPPVKKVSDATVLPYRAFVQVNSEILFIPDECPNEKKIEGIDGCFPAIEKYVGSGSFIFRSIKSSTTAYVLTAGHICDHKNAEQGMKGKKLAHRFRVKDYFGDSHDARILFTSTTFDACVMIVDDVQDDIEIAKIASRAPVQGERVYNLSAPKNFFSDKAVLTFNGFFSGSTKKLFIFTIPATVGSSGSAVFNDNGQIVSIISAVPVEEIEINGTKSEKQLMESICYGLKTEEIQIMMESLQTFDLLFGPNISD